MDVREAMGVKGEFGTGRAGDDGSPGALSAFSPGSKHRAGLLAASAREPRTFIPLWPDETRRYRDAEHADDNCKRGQCLDVKPVLPEHLHADKSQNDGDSVLQ